MHDEALTIPAARPRPAALSITREFLQTALLVAILFLGMRALLQNFRVDGPSMNPTLASGEFLWVNKAAYFQIASQYVFGGPQRGDIAVLKSPDATEDIDLIKRVIGMPGDHVLVDHGRVVINGQLLDEPYIRFGASYTYPADGQPIVVPDGQYFVLGDNRSNSRDSHFGWFVPADNLVGRAFVSYWPPAAWSVFPSVAYATP
ncbi:MAG: signal peptidase I [Chloroflexi bacterium]|nr:signal peptidase I [Chloroflexota bacterium]